MLFCPCLRLICETQKMSSCENRGFEGDESSSAKTGYDNQAYKADGAEAKHDIQPHSVDDVHIPDDHKWGYFSCISDSMQCCNNPKAVLFWLSWFALIQGENFFKRIEKYSIVLKKII